MSGIGLSSLWQLAFQVSPIILVNGIASTIPGGLLPIMVITEALDIVGGLLTGNGIPDSLDEFFAQYLPMPGSTIISNSIGEYPFANQAVAANAIIKNPNTVSMLMIAPVREAGGYITKLPIFTALKAALDTHNASGGLYHIATPAFIYENCIMTGMVDATDGESRQRQTMWQLDFRQPLVTQADAQNALNSLMSKIANGNQIVGDPTWSGPSTGTGTATAGVGTSNAPAGVQGFDPAAVNAAAGAS